jgi:shikimate 5-dehydrogenase
MKSLARELDVLLAGLDGLGLGLSAMSVTIPFKEEAAAFAGVSGAVNTLIRRGPSTFASANTDREAMESLLPVGAGAIAVVAGAGGTARAAVDALKARGFLVGVHGRSPHAVRELCKASGAHLVEDLGEALRHAFVFVNATPLGLKQRDPLPCPAELLSPRLTVLDAPYRKGEETALTREARARGARVVDGRRLLVAQGALQARLFTGTPVTTADLLSALPRRHRDLFPEDLA